MINYFKKQFTRFFDSEKKIDLVNIKKYREFDTYELSVEVFERRSVYISAKLPSEPPEGITYEFGPSGYIGDSSSEYCTIPTVWKNVDNYCHWNFVELPVIILAFESSAKNIILPDEFIQAKLPFQKSWIDLLIQLYPEKKILKLSKQKIPSNTLIPVNHATSKSETPIGKCLYRNYHVSRATPYLIHTIDTKYKHYFIDQRKHVQSLDYIYINRSNRRLNNEEPLQYLLIQSGFTIVNLETVSLQEQVMMFHHAKIVIGFHGAGLTNLLYCTNSTIVFEIVDKDCVSPCYLDGIVIPGRKATRTYFHMLSEMKQMEYYAIESHDYHLDLPSFEKMLSKVMSNFINK